MSRINNIIKPLLAAIAASAIASQLILYVFAQAPQNFHWAYSIGFHLLVALVLGILAVVDPNPKTLASNLLSVSLGRLLICGIAFLIYKLNFPNQQKWFMVHFMIHYVLFTFFEIVFLLKIVNQKSPAK